MSPLNRGGPLLGPRMPPVGMRPRFGARPPMPGMPPRMPPPMGPMFGPMRQRMMPPRPGGIMRPGGPPPLFGPRGRGVPPLMPPMMCPRGMGPRGPPMRPGLRGLLPPQGLLHMRPRFPMGNGNIAAKAINNAKKVSKLEELELKKPWMTDEIRGEIQKKNKLYAKAKKNKDAKEWNEFKDLRNKVTRMIRDAKNEYLTKNPEQAHIYDDDIEPYDQRDENYVSSEEEDSVHYCEVCDREFNTAELLDKHTETHKTCGIDGCTFSAHPKLVEKHISMQHCTGLYHRMKNLTTPEDINKWIAERKKKYPTKINIEQKHAEETEKRERGEMIKETKSIPESKYPEKSVRDKKRKVRKRRVQELKPNPEPYTVEFYRGLRPFAGTANLCRNEYDEEEMEQIPHKESSIELDTVLAVPDFASNISDDEDPLPNPLSSDAPKAQPAKDGQSCLLSLVANYGSDSSDDEAPEQIPIKRVRTEIPLDNDSQMPEETIIEPTKDPQELSEESLVELANNSKQLSEVTFVEPTQSEDSQKRIEDSSKSNEKNARPTKFSTKQSQEKRPIENSPRNNMPNGHRSKKRLMLLQRLLSRSIQHERNIICQCIKYISDNGFFQ